MSFREQSHNGKGHLIGFANDYALNVGDDLPGHVGQLGRIVVFLRRRRDGQLDFLLRSPDFARHQDVQVALGAGHMLANHGIGNFKWMAAVRANAFWHVLLVLTKWRRMRMQFFARHGLCPEEFNQLGVSQAYKPTMSLFRIFPVQTRLELQVNVQDMALDPGAAKIVKFLQYLGAAAFCFKAVLELLEKLQKIRVSGFVVLV